MFKPIDAILYFYVWVSHSMYGNGGIPVSDQYISCTTTTQHIITNEEYYNINDTIESILIKEE